MGDTGINNQRVTNAILQKDIGYLTGEFREFRNEVKDSNKIQDKRLRELEREQTRLKTIVGVWNSINTLGVIVVTAFKGYFNGE